MMILIRAVFRVLLINHSYSISRNRTNHFGIMCLFFRTFKPQNLPPHLRPIKMKPDKDATLNAKGSPFIYSPIQSHGAKQKMPGSKMGKPVCERQFLSA